MPDKIRPSDAAAGKTDWAALDALTDSEVEAAAAADPDCPSNVGGAHLMARAKKLRMTMKLSQSTFSERYHIPLATLISWERHEVNPDAVALAFLDAIAADPDGIAAALARSREAAE